MASLHTVLKGLTIFVALTLVLLLTLFLTSPWLVSRFSPDVLKQMGFTKVVVEIGYPQWRGISINRLQLVSNGIAIHGKNVRIDYALSELVHGQVAAIAFESLDISVYLSNGESEDGFSIEQVFVATPFQHLRAEQLRLQVPEIGFIGVGSADLGRDVLSFTMAGVAPEPASHFQLTATLSQDGVFDANFNAQEAGDSDYLILQGRIEEDTLRTEGDFRLGGYALELVTLIAGLPQGTGTVTGEFQTQLPWPPPASLIWQDIDAVLPKISVEWASADNELTVYVPSGSVRLDHGKVNTNLTGIIRGNLNERNISLQLPADYQLHYQSGVLEGASGLRLGVKDGETDLNATIRSFILQVSPTTILNFNADIVGVVTDTLHVDGQLGGQVTIEPAEQLIGKAYGRLEFNGDMQVGEQHHQAKVQTAYRVTGDSLSAEGTASSGIFDHVSFDIDYDLKSAAGVFGATTKFKIRQPIAAALVPAWTEVYDLDHGIIDATIKLTWRTLNNVAADIAMSLSDARAHYDKYEATGISGRLNLHTNNIKENEWSLDPTVLTAARLEVGVPIEDLQLGMSWSKNLLNVTSARAALLGGQVRATPFVYDIATGGGAFELMLEKIDLAAVLALEGDDIAGTGTLNGTLPVLISDNQASVQGGVASAEAPGGVIRLSPALSGTSGHPGLDFALVALQDFTYSDLTAEIDYTENGDLSLAVHLLGKNPAVEKDRPIQYNLKITENLPVLFESLRVQDELTERIERKVGK